MKFYIILFLNFLTVLCCAQNAVSVDELDKKAQKKYAQALEHIKKKETNDAIKSLSEVLQKNPGFYDAHYKLGWQYLKIEKREEALSSFKTAYELSLDPEYKLAGILSQLQEEKMQFDEALHTINKLKDKKQIDSTMLDVINSRIEELQFRQHAYRNPLDLKIEALGPEINGPYSDALPAINAEGNKLIFSKRLPNDKAQSRFSLRMQEDLYYSLIDGEGKFEEARPIDELNTELNEAAHCFSQDGKILIFTACERESRQNGCDLYISFWKDNMWSNPVNMGPTINSRYWESQPSLSADNKTLYFASTRKGGFGKIDIWKVELIDGRWSEPKNLGPEINTKEDEESPFIHADGQTLYFRSNGHIGMGGHDLFMSKYDNNAWAKPLNLGYPINTKMDEGTLFVDIKGQTAYFSSDKTSDNNYDIYKFDLPAHLRPNKASYLKIRVSDALTGKTLKATVNISTQDRGYNDQKLLTDKNGEALAVLILGEYFIHVQKENYLLFSEHLEILKVNDLKEAYIFDIKLIPIQDELEELSKAIVLNNIFFESGSAILLDKSEMEIQALTEMLENNPNLHITIIGHTDDIGNDDDNLNLSIDRAKAVYDRLLESGIDVIQISYKGMGESQPRVANDSEENRALNRRTEFVARSLN